MLADEIIWAGFKNGDKDMLMCLYKKYYHCLLFAGLKEEKDAGLVKDIIQQQFLYLWEKRDSIQQAENVKAYLISSVLRKLRSFAVQSSNKAKLEVAWTNFNHQSEATPEEKLISKEVNKDMHALMMKFLDSLSPRQKELISLKFYEGLSYEEIVERTGLSYRTVYNKIHEALKRLREDMGGSESALFAQALSLLIVYISVAGNPMHV